MCVLLCRQEKSLMSLGKLLSFVQALVTEWSRLPSQPLSFIVCLHVEIHIYHVDYNLDLRHCQPSSFNIILVLGLNPITNPSDREYIGGECVERLGRTVWDCLWVASNNPIAEWGLIHSLENIKFWLFSLLELKCSGFLRRLSWQGFLIWVFFVFVVVWGVRAAFCLADL